MIGFSIALCALILWLFTIEPAIEDNKKRKQELLFLETKRNSNDEFSVFAQDLEDLKFKHSVERAARDQFSHWVKWHIWRISTEGMEAYKAWQLKPEGVGSIYIRNPIEFGFFYTVHNEKTAKYLSADFNQLVSDEFEKLKAEWLKEEEQWKTPKDNSPNYTTA